MSSSVFKGVVHGKTIELEREPGLPDGQSVSVAIQPLGGMPKPEGKANIPPVETWMDRLIYDRAVDPDERIVKGTRLAAEALVTELEAGRSDEELRQAHPELTPEDVAALRNYAETPIPARRSFGAWADEAEELDEFLEELRQLRKLPRRGIEE